jgi:DNA-directed RNA polymerase specialized sigma24 family protein
MPRERRTPTVQAPDGVDLVELAAASEPSESIEDLVARDDLARVVERAMARLPDEQRTAIVLKEYHGLTFQEIADLLGCPLSTVKTRLYQGLTVLRRELAKTEGGFGRVSAEHDGVSARRDEGTRAKGEAPALQLVSRSPSGSAGVKR